MQVGTLVVSESEGIALSTKFKIKRTLASGRAGTCELEVINLSPEHRRELTSLPRRGTFVSVDAGYLEGQSRLFTGDLRKAVVSVSGTDWTTKITAGDGEHALRTARVSRSFAAGTTIESVATHIAEAMGVGIGNAVTMLRGARLGSESMAQEGTMLHGRAATELTRLCDSARLTWSVQDGNLQLLQLGGALARTAIRLGSDSGLLESPEYVNRRTIKLKALLQPGLVPGQQVVIDSAVIDQNRVVPGGSWKIHECEYSGDTVGNDWTVAMTLHRPLPPLVTSAAPTTGAT